MCLLFGSPKISVHIMSVSDGWLLLKSCWVHTQVTNNCFVVVWLLGTNCGFIIGIHPLSKSEFMQWKDVDCPTFTSMCNSAINWWDYSNSFFSGIQTDCLWQTIVRIPDRDFNPLILHTQRRLSAAGRAIATRWISASCLLTPMSRNSVLEELSVKRFAAVQQEIWVRAFWRWSVLESKSGGWKNKKN